MSCWQHPHRCPPFPPGTIGNGTPVPARSGPCPDGSCRCQEGFRPLRAYIPEPDLQIVPLYAGRRYGQ